jgi:3-dehydroquinate synthase
MTDAESRDVTEIAVTGESEYTVTVGRGLTGRVAEALGDRVDKVLIVHTSTVGKLADELRSSLQRPPSVSRSRRSAGRSWARPTSPVRTR